MNCPPDEICVLTVLSIMLVFVSTPESPAAEMPWLLRPVPLLPVSIVFQEITEFVKFPFFRYIP